MNQDFSCMLTSREGVFEDLVRHTIVKHLPQLSMEEEVSWCGVLNPIENIGLTLNTN